MKTYTVRFVMRSRFIQPARDKGNYVDEVMHSNYLKSLWDQISKIFYLDGIEGFGDTSKDVVWIKDGKGKTVFGEE